ncbi:uncharacterized protein CLUP02_17800 [Colletotrichum lupini]|uniref:Clr5 domain-containing protein n=1 Tax=Colletotrichum lupini TaxID=145971 RepID=A0A9Q8SF90_9PEZI|nr:uncharacterized protein CLUP02_17800 [Colletotrichum lupini]UQC76287.1 hypothetical protein CLUP02_17800 [Colletotrichum lupini]
MASYPKRSGLMPPRESDWEDRKQILYSLYMLKNLSLGKVVDEMSASHSFVASERMYKRRFVRWEWFKYHTRRFQATSLKPGSKVEKCRGKTTRQTKTRKGKQTILRSCDVHQRSSTVAGDLTFSRPQVPLRNTSCESLRLNSSLSTFLLPPCAISLEMTHWTARLEKSLPERSRWPETPRRKANSTSLSTTNCHFGAVDPLIQRLGVMDTIVPRPMERRLEMGIFHAGHQSEPQGLKDLDLSLADEPLHDLSLASFDIQTTRLIPLGSSELASEFSLRIKITAFVPQSYSKKLLCVGSKETSFPLNMGDQLGNQKNSWQSRSPPVAVYAEETMLQRDTPRCIDVGGLIQSLDEAQQQLRQLQSTLASLAWLAQGFRA